MRNFLQRHRGLARGTAFSAPLLFVGLMTLPSYAVSDPTGGVFTTAQTDLTTLIIPAAAALVLVGIVFAVAVKWVSKAMKKG